MAFTHPDAATLPRHPVTIGGVREERGSGAATPHIHSGWPRASSIQGVVIEMSRKVADGLAWNA